MSVDLALSLLIALLNNATAISALISKAKAENRDLTEAEIQGLFDDYATARAKAEAAIAAARAAGH
jgi:2,4-dienoyl-CoA reductase-like NADH-dependent reductase (Old Yellow Enzyme family)